MSLIDGSYSKPPPYRNLSHLGYIISPTAPAPLRQPLLLLKSPPPPQGQKQVLQLPQVISRVELFLKNATDSITQATSSAGPGPSPFLHLPGVTYKVFGEIQSYIYDVAVLDERLSIAKRVRLNYDGDSQTLIITCAGRAHESVLHFTHRILGVLEANDKDFFGQHKNDPDFQIHSVGSTDVEYTNASGKRSKRQPDGSLCLDNDTPFLVCEVADTQTQKSVMQRVEDYLVGTEGQVRVVIIIKLARGKTISKRKRHIEDEFDGHSGSGNDNLGSVPEPNDPGRQNIDGGPSGRDAPQTVPQINYSRGFFWVYTYTQSPGDRGAEYAITCLHEEQEFYPVPPATSLELSWADILNPDEIPADLIGKTAHIPFSILTELFTPVASSRPRPAWRRVRKIKLERGQVYPGKVLSSDPEEPESELSQPDAEGDDLTYSAGRRAGPDTPRTSMTTRSKAKE